MKGFGNTCLLIFSLVLFNISFAQENNATKPFPRSVYKAARQNWSVSSTSKGEIFFANHKGLLEFNGSTWQLHELPNQTLLRAVKVISDSLIFSSGYMELGFWKRDKFGQLQYNSLRPKAEKFFTKNIEFWNIVNTGNITYFHSFNGILAYENDSIYKVAFPGLVSAINTVDEKVLVAVKDEGIFQISNNNLTPFFTDDYFANKLIRFILPYKNNQLLLGTEANGIIIYDGTEFSQWKPELKNYFIENELNRGHYSENGELILGTIIDGIIVFDENENLIKKVNISNGLLNNTVLGIETDPWNNIWLALDDGISYVSSIHNNNIAIETIPGIGAIYSTALFQGKRYFGTNQGLFVQTENEDPTFIPGTQGQIWDCTVLDEKLWVGHNQGTFLIENNKIKQISEISGGFSLKENIKENSLIQSTYTSLLKYYKNETGEYQYHIIDGFFDLLRYIEIDHLNNIWASHMHLGVFKLTTDDNRDTITEVQYFGEDVFSQNHSIHVFKIENRIVFTTAKKLFTYDDLNNQITEYKKLNEQLGKFAAAHRIIKAPNHHYWFITQNGIGLFKINNEKTELINQYPKTLFRDTPPVDQYENILPLSEKKAILCLQNGIATIDASLPTNTFDIGNHSPTIRKIELRNRTGENTSLPLNKKLSRIKYGANNLTINVSFPHLFVKEPDFQYFLEGLDNDWSQKTQSSEFSFERLPFGTYNLKIRATDAWGNESKACEIPFEVLPPWYLSKLAVILYFIFLIAVLLGFRSLGIRQTKRKEQQEHEKREKELIKLRNEKLRNEIQHKSKELANSTMSMIKKNEFLLDLKNSIDKQKAELGSRYPDKYYNHLNQKIDDNISNKDDWQVFETNFERAHEQFFHKMKDFYPELTSSDLRLCAYLRMNLSSKEIAPLLGISVRGVENHRYRLRKKMNLQHDDSLTDKILSV